MPRLARLDARGVLHHVDCVSGRSIFKRIGATGVQEIQYFPGEFCSGSRRRDVAEARGSISWIAVRELG